MSSSGSLPFASYHRASQLGYGTYGSVVRVYNNDGEEYAMKLFTDSEDNHDESLSSSTSSSEPGGCHKYMSLGALREISCLRLLRGHNGHPNIVNLVDVQPNWNDTDAEPTGDGRLGIALPLYNGGSLQQAVEKGFFASTPRRVKVELAHGILSAIAFLHDNDILHRDIKPDNIMLDVLEARHETAGGDGTSWRAVLIDFSLAKKLSYYPDTLDPFQHTAQVGTVTYVAPEVVAREPYHKPSDLWSVGVVLLELLQDKPLAVAKDRHAFSAIHTALESLPTYQPFPDLVRNLLEMDPATRWTARQALAHPLFVKFGLAVPDIRIVDVPVALPVEEDENDSASTINKKQKSPQRLVSRRREKRVKMVEKFCQQLKYNNPLTPKAALEYCSVLTQVDDTIDDLSKSQSLLNCVVLAYRFFELEVLDLQELDEANSGTFAEWSLEDYVDDEATIFMILDFCLYPRKIYCV